MSSILWSLDSYGNAGYISGFGRAVKCYIGKKLYQAIVENGDTGLSVDQLGFTHAALSAIPPNVFRIGVYDSESLGIAIGSDITKLDISKTKNMISAFVIDGTADVGVNPNDPHPILTLWATTLVNGN